MMEEEDIMCADELLYQKCRGAHFSRRIFNSGLGVCRLSMCGELREVDGLLFVSDAYSQGLQ